MFGCGGGGGRGGAGAIGGHAGGAGGAGGAALPEFGSSCTPGTEYIESFATDPSTRWTTVAGTWTWDSTNSVYVTTVGAPQDVVWAGARPAWGDYKVSALVRMDTASGDGGLITRVVDTGTGTPVPNDAGNMYYAGLLAGNVKFGLMKNNVWTMWSQVAAPVKVGEWHTLEVDVIGTTISVLIDGTQFLTRTDASFATGGFGLRAFAIGMTYGQITVTCL
jgi:hypothetical protein